MRIVENMEGRDYVITLVIRLLSEEELLSYLEILFPVPI